MPTSPYIKVTYLQAMTACLFLTALLLPGCAQNPADRDQRYEQSGTRETGDVESARVHTELGAEYFRLQRYEVALDEFNTAIERSPTYALAHNGLGLVYAALGEKSRAEAAFQRAIQLQPGNSESHNNYGRFLCDQGRYDASIKEFMLAIKNPLYKTPQVAYYNAGVCATRNQQKGLAESYFMQALAIDPLAHASAYQLANLQFGRGEPRLALNSLQNSVNVAPTAESLWLAIRLCRALQLQDDARFYTVQLYKLYPNANETKQLQKME